MGLVTDQQHLAYVLRPGETTSPEGLQEAFRQSARVAQIYADELKPGTVGTDVKFNVERRAKSDGNVSFITGPQQELWLINSRE